MPSFRKPGEQERTIALTGDDIEPASLPHYGEDTITLERRAPHDDEDPSMRDRTVPFYNPHEDLEATTNQLPVAAANAFVPPPFPGAAFVKPSGSIARASTASALTPVQPLMTSRVESVATHDDGRASAFAPISRLPPPSKFPPPPSTTRSPSSRDEVAPVPDAASMKAPGWVMGYLLLCAALTLIGLVVLFFERRMLGSASPF